MTLQNYRQGLRQGLGLFAYQGPKFVQSGLRFVVDFVHQLEGLGLNLHQIVFSKANILLLLDLVAAKLTGFACFVDCISQLITRTKQPSEHTLLTDVQYLADAFTVWSEDDLH